jgi:hypothetical protein
MKSNAKSATPLAKTRSRRTRAVVLVRRPHAGPIDTWPVDGFRVGVAIPGRVDEKRKPHALALCDYILSRLDLRGRYVPEESIFAESIGYRASLAAYLAEAGRVLGRPQYIEGAGAILRDVQRERIGDMWPVGIYADFPRYQGLDLDWREKYTVNPDVRYTTLVVLGLGSYYRASGDRTVIEPARRALAAILGKWDMELERQRREWLILELLAMAISIWEGVLPEFARYKAPLVQTVLDTFVAMAPNGFPFFTMYRTVLLLGETGDRYLYSHLKPGIDALLAEPKLRCPENADDFFHYPKTADHVNVRGNGAVAITLRLFDQVARKPVYTQGKVYRHVAAWFDSQRREDGAYYGARQHGRGRRFGLGSPDQYLPLSWLIGGL